MLKPVADEGLNALKGIRFLRRDLDLGMRDRELFERRCPASFRSGWILRAKVGLIEEWNNISDNVLTSF
jgi:hypothetical protein